MISLLAFLLSVAVLILCLTQTVLVIRYYRFHTRGEPGQRVGHSGLQQPPVAIILCLRGYEESIPDCLAGLINQDYSNYEVHVAFDSPDDRAVEQVNDFFDADRRGVQLHFFEPRQECSYKCSGIVHVIDKLAQSVEVVAFCDGDAMVNNQWLGTLVQPLLEDKTIGATTGNRWFSPYDGGIGGMLRKQWNAAAVVQMQAYDIAWGGSMALRRKAIEECGLVEIWKRSFCEDTPTTVALEDHGLRLQRIPELVVENRESTSVTSCLEWITRQLLTVRLHHPQWKLVKAHGFATVFASLLVPLTMAMLFLCGHTKAGIWLLLAWGIYQVCNAFLLWLIERCNLEVIAANSGLSIENLDRSDGDLLAGFLIQLLYPLAFVAAVKAKTVSWRGVEYRISENGREISSSIE